MTAGLQRTRMMVVGVAAAVLALIAGGVFDRWVWILLVAAVLPTALALITRRRHLVWRSLGAVVGVLGSVGIVVVVSGGDRTDFFASFGAGVQRMLSTDWPSPERADLLGTIALLLSFVTATAAELAGHRRWHLLPLAPLIAAYIALTALSAPLGVRLRWVAPLVLLSAAFATLKPHLTSELGVRAGGTDDGASNKRHEGIRQRLSSLRGERRVIPLVLIAALVAAAVSVPIDAVRRADPRRNDPATRTAALLDPIEATLALRAIEPPIPLYDIESSATLPTRWRTASLDAYDGLRWTPELTLRPIGRRLAPPTDNTVAYDVNVLDDDLTLLPFPGAPITADGLIETDEGRTIVRLAERVSPSEVLQLESTLAPSSVADSSIAAREVNERVSALTEFASELAGDGTVSERLLQLESTMRNDFVLASDAPGAGLQQALIDRFLRDTQRGTAEQFATGFVLLARSLGVDARVATGFVVDGSSGTLTLTSEQAQVWPEVRLFDGGWVAFDPVPEDEDANATPPPEEPAVQTPAAAQPPIAPPLEPSSDIATEAEVDDDAAAAALSSIRVWARRAALWLGALLLPVIVAILIVLLIKIRRRRNRLSGSGPAARVNGAWAVATDRLIDAGLTIAPSSTNAEIAAAGQPLAPQARRELHRLATLSSAVTFGSPARPELLVDDAAACLGQVETSIATEQSRLDRLRWQLSLRSLRRSTRSPVKL